jgi:hypothetical protein
MQLKLIPVQVQNEWIVPGWAEAGRKEHWAQGQPCLLVSMGESALLHTVGGVGLPCLLGGHMRARWYVPPSSSSQHIMSVPFFHSLCFMRSMFKCHQWVFGRPALFLACSNEKLGNEDVIRPLWAWISVLWRPVNKQPRDEMRPNVWHSLEAQDSPGNAPPWANKNDKNNHKFKTS